MLQYLGVFRLLWRQFDLQIVIIVRKYQVLGVHLTFSEVSGFDLVKHIVYLSAESLSMVSLCLLLLLDITNRFLALRHILVKASDQQAQETDINDESAFAHGLQSLLEVVLRQVGLIIVRVRNVQIHQHRFAEDLVVALLDEQQEVVDDLFHLVLEQYSMAALVQIVVKEIVLDLVYLIDLLVDVFSILSLL